VTGSRRPLCLLVSGPPASGKTALGRALAARLGAALLDLDVATAPLAAVVADLVGQSDLDAAELAGTTRAARYETLFALAEDNLRVGCPVVLVAPFTTERQESKAWTRIADRLTAAGGTPTLVWLRAGRELLLERLRSRGAARDLGKLADPAGFLDRIPLVPPEVAHVAVDAAAGTGEQCAVVLAGLA
jgi:predicted kinase